MRCSANIFLKRETNGPVALKLFYLSLINPDRGVNQIAFDSPRSLSTYFRYLLKALSINGRKLFSLSMPPLAAIYQNFLRRS